LRPGNISLTRTVKFRGGSAETVHAMRVLLRSESGQSIIELIVAMGFMLIVMGALSNAFASGLRASADESAQIGGQGAVRVAIDRLEYEGRCASTATLISSGAGVAFDLPSQCPHATGTVSWCVLSGSLTRFTTTDCTGTGMVLATNITSATPFCLQTTSGALPELHLSLSANMSASGAGADAQSVKSKIVIRNAAAASSTSAACP
jgi:type II secretory pathway pseudopilin PulG